MYAIYIYMYLYFSLSLSHTLSLSLCLSLSLSLSFSISYGHPLTQENLPAAVSFDSRCRWPEAQKMVSPVSAVETHRNRWFTPIEWRFPTSLLFTGGYIYIFIYLYIYIFIYLYIYIFIHTYIHTYIHIYIHTCVYVLYIYVYIHIYIHINRVHKHTHIYIHTVDRIWCFMKSRRIEMGIWLAFFGISLNIGVQLSNKSITPTTYVFLILSHTNSPYSLSR